eukprot:CAMPEP_0197827106 /NCGR_PEP_ID=MMETSP1437-20131217/3967_1 /TAXON_ID=49252 ORGANISM="Eucampia antarctica, Strain CCMP1452" /NCGR_SAMPLE_ID=MMETSP1437 /ASSEMBLY_ACC=CAM_ASM_001096 /LENGTH=486 /DNA_ID=CAMNT_0043427837 /DNA_START=456 /DNA_END=1917 /DNA_ORIENTATION=+
MIAFVWQIFFKVTIPSRRKGAIALITLGFLMKSGNIHDDTTIELTFNRISLFSRILLVLFQMACSVMATVYNEKMLKQHNCDQYLQNMCLYITSIIMNVIILSFLPGNNREKASIFSKSSIMIILTLAMAGIMTAMILRSVGSVTKCVVAASITIFTYIIDIAFFGHRMVLSDVASVFLVTVGSVIYSMYDSKAESGKVKETNDHSSININTKKDIDACNNGDDDHICEQHDTTEIRISPAETCTNDVVNRTRPIDVTEEKFTKVRQGEKVVAYIIEQLHLIGGPVSLIYGNLLHEYRNGTSKCILYDLHDKDLDIALFEKHFHAVVAMEKDIERIFGWKAALKNEERLIMVLLPPNQAKMQKGFQIDVYGFKINYPTTNLAYFPWDKVTFAMDALLPFVKHKTIAYDSKSDTKRQNLYMYMPFNAPCLLSNLFGSSFMTPDKSAKYFWRHDAYNQPRCDNRILTVVEQEELKRQLLIGGESIPLN